MNFNLLNTKPDVSKTGKLAIALYPNSLLEKKNGKHSWYARVVNRRKLSMSDIADDMVTNGVTKTKEEIMDTWRQINNAIISRLAEGLSVNTGLCTIRLSIEGSFDSPQSTYNPDKHTIDLQFRTQPEISKILNNLEPVINQAALKLPDITRIKDTNGSNTLTPGGFLEIHGKNLKVIGEDSSIGLYFENMQDSSDVIQLGIDKIPFNNPACLMCIVPTELKSGAIYQIKIITQYSTGNNTTINTKEGIFTDLTVV